MKRLGGAHMLNECSRAEQRLRQAINLADKWKLRLAELDRAGIDAKQANLWPDEQPDNEPMSVSLHHEFRARQGELLARIQAERSRKLP